MIENLRLKAKEQKGFTLIELLAVIVIMGIIAAIAIPAISNVITSSRDKANVQDALQIISAAKYYMADHPSESTVTLTNDGTGDSEDLSTYLDRVKDDKYIVTVTYTASKTYSYTIKNHEACAIVGTPVADETDATAREVSEKELSKWANDN